MTNLLKLIKDNPTLPVYAFVDGEVCGGDDFSYWLGEMGRSKKTKIICIEKYGYEKVIEYDDKDEIFEYFADKDENADKTDEELWTMVEQLPWKECILVWVGIPDSL